MNEPDSASKAAPAAYDPWMQTPEGQWNRNERNGHTGPVQFPAEVPDGRRRPVVTLNGSSAEPRPADLLQRIAAQDRQALADFYDQTAAVLMAVSVRILGDAHEAEEVIQDVFVQIWNKAASFDETLGTPHHWAVGIARNRSIDRLRSRQRRVQLLDRLQQFATLDAGPSPAPARAGLVEEERTGIRAAVGNLPPDQRLALELAFFGGQTHAEIAQATGEPLGTVKARIRRGMLKLRDTLQAYA